jgi:hypothetical protein
VTPIQAGKVSDGSTETIHTVIERTVYSEMNEETEEVTVSKQNISTKLTFGLPKQLYERLSALAEERQTSMSAVIVEALVAAYCDRRVEPWRGWSRGGRGRK